MLTEGATAAAGRDEFMQLMVTQLRNQDPLEPVKQEDFLSQLAQFSTLEGVEKLNTNFSQLLDLQQNFLRVQELSQGASLIGESVHYQAAGEEAVISKSGVVAGLHMEGNDVVVQIDGESIPISQVVGLGAKPVVKTEPPTTEIPVTLAPS